MDTDNLLDTQEEIEDVPEAVPPSRIRTVWRLVIAAVALLVLALLLYPLFQQRFRPAAAPAETQTVLTPPEATAQANPDSAKAQFELGNAYAKNGQWDRAAPAYQKAIELDPNYQAAYANLGVVYYQQGRFNLAASQYEKALELNPNDTEVAYNLGVLYLQQALTAGSQVDAGRLNQAVTQLEQVRQSAPELAEPYFSLGVAYNLLNRKQDAIQAFEAFLERDTGRDPRASQEARRYLQTLRGN